LPFTGVVGRDTDRLTDDADPTCALTSGAGVAEGQGRILVSKSADHHEMTGNGLRVGFV
jgi:hypothetical protein